MVLYVFLHSARVSRGLRHCFLTMFTYCVRLVCHSFAVSYFHRKTKMLPHKLFKCGRRIFKPNFTLTLHHAVITTHDETTFHLDEKSRRVLISRDLVMRDLVTPLLANIFFFVYCWTLFGDPNTHSASFPRDSLHVPEIHWMPMTMPSWPT